MSTRENRLSASNVFLPAVVIPAGNGEYTVKSGKPILLAEEVSVSEFARLTGISTRHIVRLCDEGRLAHRRLTPKQGSKYLIPRAEVERYRNLQGEE